VITIFKTQEDTCVKWTLCKEYRKQLYGIVLMAINEQSRLIFGRTTFTAYSTKMDGSQDLNVKMGIKIATTNQHQEDHELERKD